MVECLFTNEVVVGLNPVAVTFTYLFWKLPGYSIPYSPTQAESKLRMVNTLLMYVRDSLEDKSVLFTDFYLIEGKKIEEWLVSPASR